MAAKKKIPAGLKVKGQGSFCNVNTVAEPVYVEGNERLYVNVEKTFIANGSSRQIISKEYLALGALLLVSSYIRLTSLLTPDSVVFDEVHFGGFSKQYIKGTFFMDVHPPLAKMLFAAVGSLAGYTGDFDFDKIADVYPDVFYYYMRLFPALLGLGTIVLSYLTLRLSGCRPIICLVTAGLLAVENAQVTLSRYILLDSPLMFFIACSIYSLKKFEMQKPFTLNWYKALIACGISLGLSVSSKWVGLFTIAWVGISCIYQLWFIVGDLSISAPKIVHHFFARGLILLGIPITLYLGFFAVHFNLLVNEGTGSPFMSSAFKATLNGNTVPKNILGQVGLGSTVTIKHVETLGGYLHSHNHFYPAGSKQQQITLYPHIDTNNNWLIEAYNHSTPENEFIPLKDGMKIRLVHVNSGRRLHSHDEKAPVSERDWQKETSCYGYDGFGGDANDDFTVEIVKKRTPGAAQENVTAIQTIFRLRHAMTGNYLFSSEVKLPDWGFEQQEVTAASQGARPLTHWYIETNENSRIAPGDAQYVNYPTPSLLQKVVESHKRMWKINNGLTEHHTWQSNPQDWPFLLRGINYWVKDNKQVYLIGNAVVWWSTTLSILTFIGYFIFSLFRWQASYSVAENKEVFNFNYQLVSYVLGWALHYFPFFIMGRQLFLHHYIPAAYFGILGLGHFLDLLVSYFGQKNVAVKYISFAAIASLVTLSVLFFVKYSPLIYASPWTKGQCEASKALSGWDFDCNAFHADIALYSNVVDNAAQQTNAAEPNIQASINEAKETPFVEIEKQTVPVYDESTVENAEPAHEEEAPAVPPFEVDDSTVKSESAEPVAEVVSEEAQKAQEAIADPVEEFVDAVDVAVEQAAEAIVEQVAEVVDAVPDAAK